MELKCFQCVAWWSVWKLVPTLQTEPSLFWEVVFNLDSAEMAMASAFSRCWRSLRAAVVTSDICVSHTATKLGAHSCVFHRFISLRSPSALLWLSSASVQSAVDDIRRHHSNHVWLWWTSDSQTVHTVRNKPRACVRLIFALSNWRTQTVLILLDNQTNFSCTEKKLIPRSFCDKAWQYLV